MSLTTMDIFQQAGAYGLHLRAVGNALHVNPGRRCPSDFVPVLRADKPNLLSLLQLPFLMVESKALGVPIIFCEDEDTKAALVEAGADETSIYTRAELKILVEHNRVKPFIPDELLRLHQTKRTFKARFAN